MSNHIIKYLGAAAMLAAITACSDEVYKEVDGYVYTTEPIYLSLSTNSLDFDSKGYNTSYHTPYIDASHSWNTSGVASWVTLTPSYGNSGYNEVGVSVDENSTADPRVNIVDFSLDSYPLLSATLAINQNGAIPELMFKETSARYVDAAGEQVDLPLITNLPDNLIELTISPSVDNVTYSISNSVVKLTIGANPKTADRKLTVTVTASSNGYTRTSSRTLCQYGAKVDSYGYLDFNATGGTQEITYTANVPSRVVSSANWLTVTPTSANAGKVKLTVTATQNTKTTIRSATISIYSGENTSALTTINVTQAGVNASSSESSFQNLSARGESVSMDFTCDVDWEITTTSSFIEAIPAKGTAGTTRVKFNVAPNTSSSQRTASLSIKSLSGTKLASIFFSQRAASFNPDVERLEFEGKGGTKTVKFDSDVPIVSITGPDWITLSPSTLPSGVSTLTVTAERNPSTSSSRKGNITLQSSGGAVKIQIPVSQEKVGLADDNEINLTWKAQSYDMALNTDQKWDAALSTSDWMSLSQYSGQPGDNVTLTVTENTGEEARSGSILISTGSVRHTVTVNQQGQYIHIDGEEATLPVKASKLDLTISSTIGATIGEIRYSEGSADWITFSVTDDGSGNYLYKFDVTANPNAFTRSAEIVFKPANYEGTVDHQGVIYKLYQLGRELSVSASEIYCNGAEGTSEPVSITADGRFAVERAEGDNWFLVATEGNSFTVTTTANTTGATRRGSVIVKLLDLPDGQEKSVTIPVIQSDTAIGFTLDDYTPNQDY